MLQIAGDTPARQLCEQWRRSWSWRGSTRPAVFLLGTTRPSSTGRGGAAWQAGAGGGGEEERGRLGGGGHEAAGSEGGVEVEGEEEGGGQAGQEGGDPCQAEREGRQEAVAPIIRISSFKSVTRILQTVGGMIDTCVQ